MARALTQKGFTTQAGERAVVWINPARVTRHRGTKWPVGKARLERLSRVVTRPGARLFRHALKQAEPFLVPAAHFGASTDVRRTPKYAKIADFLTHLDQVDASAWYRELMAELDTRGIALHKQIEMRTPQEIIDFLETYAAGLVHSLRENGFSRAQASYESTAVIDADGALCKSGSGNHRFNICHALGIGPYPLRIVGAHEAWWGSDRAPGVDDILGRLAEIEAAHR